MSWVASLNLASHLQAFLVDQFENLLERAVADDKPFMAVIFFHGAHIPYIASPETRAVYATMRSPVTGQLMDENEQDCEPVHRS